MPVVSRIDHVAVVVRDIRRARRLYTSLGFRAGAIVLVRERYREERREHLYYGCSLRAGGRKPFIWLMQPKDRSGPLARFLRERGEGLHHIGLVVGDAAKCCKALKKRGVKLIREACEFPQDREVRALIHPRSSFGTLIELVQPLRLK
ncbi:MAG: VOC family protein [Aigarchaeota archaeon]|nr:VOC family protein [Candidatus Pelearchaeum maunauluense]